MGTLAQEGEEKIEMDDSGCVQDVGPPLQLDKNHNQIQLLDMSDDVLLSILKFCSASDLKALGFTCPRLGRLILDRTLWTRVEHTNAPAGIRRMRWLLTQALGSGTTQLHIRGYANEAAGCLGHIGMTREEVEKKKASKADAQYNGGNAPEVAENEVEGPNSLERLHRLYAQQMNNARPWSLPSEVDPEEVVVLDGQCPGPQFTLTQCMLKQLRTQCALTSLSLEYCNIDSSKTGISTFPPTLKRLSLRGSKCYNLPLDKSFLFNVQEYLPDLEVLDFSDCEWLEPAAFLPLSKVAKLTELVLRNCPKLAEFVAYASLATRYGFRKLKIMDLRGSPVGDSEVSALGWLPGLEELYVSPAAPPAPPAPPAAGGAGGRASPTSPYHSHARDELLPQLDEREPWELDEPEYFKVKLQKTEPLDIKSTSLEDLEDRLETTDPQKNLCFHGVDYNMCTDGTSSASKYEIGSTEEEPPAAPERCTFIEIVAQRQRDPEMESSNDEEDEEDDDEEDDEENDEENDEQNNEENDEVPAKRRRFNEDANDKSADKPCSSKDKEKSNKASNYKKENEDKGPATKRRKIGDKSREKQKDNEEDENDETPRKRRRVDDKSDESNESCSSTDGPATHGSPKSNQTEKSDDSCCSTDGPATNESSKSNQTDASDESCCSTDEPAVKKSSKYQQTDDPQPGTSKPKAEAEPGPSKNPQDEDSTQDDDDSDGDDDAPIQIYCRRTVNEGASTSKDGNAAANNNNDNDSHDWKVIRCGNDPDSELNKLPPSKIEYVRFRQNEDPVFLQTQAEIMQEIQTARNIGGALERELRENIERSRQDARNAREARDAQGNIMATPRAHVLYVNVGQQLHTVYRLAIQNEPTIFYSYSRNSNYRYRPNLGTVHRDSSSGPAPLDATAVVTDSAVRRFGRSDIEDYTLIHIGSREHFPGEPASRPDRANLRVLSLTGFRNITDRSLEHLISAAPNLQRIDFSGTRVTERGVNSFRSLRPDCEVEFSPFVEGDKNEERERQD